MMKAVKALMFFTVLLSGSPALAGITLATVPAPREVQLTIYQPADLCLVREYREQPLRKGTNRLQISWAGTLIDPTSLELTPLEEVQSLKSMDLSFPPRTRDRAVWILESETDGIFPMEITYLTSGLSWSSVYTGVLGEDENFLRLESHVKITNRSGRDYRRAQLRILAGEINLIDTVAGLAEREHPYGRPEDGSPDAPVDSAVMKRSLMALEQAAVPRPPEMTGEAVSDLFLFTIEGAESISDGSARTLRLKDPADVPVANFYRYDERRFGNRPVRFLTFVNGKTGSPDAIPLPPGHMTVYRETGREANLSYQGQCPVPYVPVGETAELALGPVTDLIVEPRLMEEASDGYSFDRKGDISGWDQIHRWEVEMFNSRSVPVTVQIDRHALTPVWRIEHDAEDAFEKVDSNRFRFTRRLEPGERKTFSYRITSRYGVPIE